MTDHTDTIIREFSKQATAFAQLAAHSHDSALRLGMDQAGITPQDTILDVACGPGILACAMAERAAHVTGLDLTPAMIQQAHARQQSLGLNNVSWRIGDGMALPFADGAFSLVTCRYAFHHLQDPVAMLREMYRVCTPTGRIQVIDVTPATACRGAYDQMERLRDPSHTQAMTQAELTAAAHKAGLQVIAQSGYRLDVPMTAQIQASILPQQSQDGLRTILTADADSGHDRLGVNARWQDGDVVMSYPISIVLLGRADQNR